MKTNADLLLEATQAPSISAISKKIGVPKPTFNTQVQQSRIPTDTLVSISRAYDLDILTLLSKLEIITAFEARKARTSASLGDFSDEELAKELYERTLREALNRKDQVALAAESDDQQDLDEGEMY
ncbi:hypothetical protein IDM48_04245 [Rothia amarae]|uniref:Uncharacterized protein n=1 Tax=Rothia amarae TaxID=169480 RepID=A0A7H2BLS3_9MICC|nr:hypothetical protein [Rothia amarae]QNV40619.1 hypothetical protein IDM48_04245 [Rothia amarae]